MKSGVYGLVIEAAEAFKIQVGKLGELEFQPGFYVYVGSAMNGLQARISRHKASKKKLHWHIDYLLAKAKLIKAIKFHTNQRLECKLAAHVARNADSEIKRFGCSDCCCSSHLFFFPTLKKAINGLESYTGK